MSLTSDYSSYSTKIDSPIIAALESNLRQSLFNLQDLVLEFEQLYINSERYKTQFIKQQEKCESNNCKSSEVLKKVIASKDIVIQSAACALTKLSETKNFSILDEIFRILCGDTSTPTTTEKSKFHDIIKQEQESPVYSPENPTKTITGDLAKEESLLEIEGTPTGRRSPIIQPKKLRSNTSNNPIERDKKKCPDNCPRPTPEKKVIKLSYPTPTKGKSTGRLKQARLNLIKLKPSNTVDLTSSPDFSGGCRVTRSDGVSYVQPLIKKESVESDDTILPSPTSGPVNFTKLCKTMSKGSPSKFKPPLSTLKIKYENELAICDIENNDVSDATHIQDSINLLHPARHINTLKHTPKKCKISDEDTTHCETNDSISLLQQVQQMEKDREDTVVKQNSPKKSPLSENINITNIPEDDIHIDSSMSLLSREIKPINKLGASEDKIKKKIPAVLEPVYKEPTVRKKAEKRALPGWNCEECKNFYDELYKNDPDMLAKKMEECSKHRGKYNPVRPKTPPGFWNPRWSVPRDTEEFNKRNNAA